MRVAIVGAGIIGTSCAHFLAAEGHEVLLLDARDPGTGTSFGNAGVLSFESCLALARPSVLRSLPRLLADPCGPLRIRWRDVPRLLPWLLRFARNCTAMRAERLAERLVALIRSAEEAHDRVIAECGLAPLVRPTGWLKVARSEAGFRRGTGEERAALERFGMPFRVLDRADIEELEPGLAPGFRHGLLLEADRSVDSPLAYTRGIFETVLRRGGRHLPLRVQSWRKQGARLRAAVAGEREIEADLFLLAAGAFSAELLRPLGIRLPLACERGYHLMLEPGEARLGRPVFLIEDSFILTPIEGAIRLTNGVELAALETPPDFAWPRRLLPRARSALSGLPGDVRSEWMGHRPSLPDGLPVIGPAPGIDNLLLAFGHQHLGLTLGPLTGRILADLVAGRDPGIDLAPFRADRPFTG